MIILYKDIHLRLLNKSIKMKLNKKEQQISNKLEYWYFVENGKRLKQRQDDLLIEQQKLDSIKKQYGKK